MNAGRAAADEDAIYAGIELGGTKVGCAAGRSNGTLLHREEVPTRDPETTLADVRDVLDEFATRSGSPRALGIATFGPVRLNATASDYGCIGLTPKLPWRGVNLLNAFRSWRDLPIDIQTDVGGAAIGEATWGAAIGCDPVVYITVGTGIGGGVLVHGRPVTGLLHPEVGHMRVPRALNDSYAGGCPYHEDCIEGLAAGPSIVGRWGAQLNELPPEHPAYDTEAHYIAHLVVNTILSLSPQRIVLGGGVMSNAPLFPLIRNKVRELLNGYIAVDEIEKQIDQFVVPPRLGANAGVLGAIAMAVARVSEHPPIA